MKDGVDYVPARAPVLLGHHFASIAGAGPIVGPILAAAFGWLPCVLWIVLGSIFVGGVHDFSSLMASVRHRGRSIGEVISQYIGNRGKMLFLIFTWFTLILVIAVFTLVVSSAFASNGSVATASILFILLALGFGFSVYRWSLPLLPATVVGVILLFGAVWLSFHAPIQATQPFWIGILFVYIYIASVTPVWILLQPRDYLNAYLLYALLGGGLVGIFVLKPDINFPAFTSMDTDLGMLFPVLFVTIACGAVSGFHSLVASGTTAKQLDNEGHARPVGYGSMLTEGVLAIVALLAAISFSLSDYQAMLKDGGGPIVLFSRGIGKFMGSLGIPEQSAVTFGALAISAFALTSLDTCMRLARYVFQEFFERSDGRKTVLSSNRYVSTAITLAVAAALTLSGKTLTLWPLFGSANQMLAALALLAVAMWLLRKKTPVGFIAVPLVFMFTVTLSALGLFSIQHYREGHLVLASISLLLFLTALVLAGESIRVLRKARKT